MKRDSLGVLFFLKKNQLLKNGEAPVSMRITVNGQREEVRTKKSINPNLWNQAKECSRARDKLFEEQYNQDDLLLKEVNGEFVRSFEFFMKTSRRC